MSKFIIVDAPETSISNNRSEVLINIDSISFVVDVSDFRNVRGKTCIYLNCKASQDRDWHFSYVMVNKSVSEVYEMIKEAQEENNK